MMKKDAPKLLTVDTYIASFPLKISEKLLQLRRLVYQTCPDVHESMSYGMPAYKLFGKPLIYYAAFQKHIGVYATPTWHAAFAKKLKHYKQGKGSVQFPLDEELPIGLIEQMVQWKMHEITISASNMMLWD